MKPLMWGAGLTIAIMLALGIGTLFNFEQLFIQFHMLSFTNTLWQLDPSRDYLIMMFPEGFFRDAAMFGAMAITIEAVILGSIAAWLMAVNPVR
jgi:integral membrane protein (TIGR01906 family)